MLLMDIVHVTFDDIEESLVVSKVNVFRDEEEDLLVISLFNFPSFCAIPQNSNFSL